MKKLLALLLSVVMLLSACAFAEEAATVTHTHKLSNVYLVSGDQVIDLSSLSLEFDVEGGEKADACRLHLNSGDETVAEIGLTTVDGDYIIHLQSESLGHVDYAIDPVVLLAKIMDKGRNSLVEMLESLDTTEIARSILSALSQISEAAEASAELEPAEEPVIEEPDDAQTITIDLSKLHIEGDLVGTLLACMSEPQTVEMGGVEYTPAGEINIADGTYTSVEFTFTNETLCTILDMLYMDDEPTGLGDMVRASGLTFELHITVQGGEDEGLNRIVDIDGTMDVGDSHQTIAMYFNTFNGPEGETTAVTIGQTQNDVGTGLGFQLTRGQHEGEAFTPGSIDMANAVVLTDLDLDQAFNTLNGAMFTVGADLLSAVLGPMMQVMLVNVEAE